MPGGTDQNRIDPLRMRAFSWWSTPVTLACFALLGAQMSPMRVSARIFVSSKLPIRLGSSRNFTPAKAPLVREHQQRLARDKVRECRCRFVPGRHS